jgi:hypothetical protein
MLHHWPLFPYQFEFNKIDGGGGCHHFKDPAKVKVKGGTLGSGGSEIIGI